VIGHAWGVQVSHEEQGSAGFHPCRNAVVDVQLWQCWVCKVARDQIELGAIGDPGGGGIALEDRSHDDSPRGAEDGS
jgi:hypothetical protein